MKFLIFFALAFETVSSKDLYSPLIEVPVLENEGRISNAHTATPGQFKYMVGLDFNLGPDMLFCGGSLIGNRWVLTAAHCTIAAPWVMVYLGSNIRECLEQFYNVSDRNIIGHPGYNPSTTKNDIGLVQIPATTESDNIGFVRLPSNENNKYLGNSAVLTGWGDTDIQTDLSDDLKYAILEVSPPNICSERYGVKFSDDDRICVVTHNKSSPCHGDSGGPFVLGQRNVQIGLVSFGADECSRGIPAIFTRVSAYRIWILVRTGIRY